MCSSCKKLHEKAQPFSAALVPLPGWTATLKRQRCIISVAAPAASDQPRQLSDRDFCLCCGASAAVEQPRQSSDRDVFLSPRYICRGWKTATVERQRFLSLPRYICRGWTTATVGPAAVRQQVTEAFFYSKQHHFTWISYIYMLIAFGRSVRAKITLLRVFWVASKLRYQEHFFISQNIKNHHSCMIHSSSSMF